MRSILVLVAVLGACDAGKLTCKDAVLKARAATELTDDEVETMIGTCELHDWSGTARSCVAAAKGVETIDKCDPDLADRTAHAMTAMAQFADQMCACHDTACAQRVSDEMAKWGQQEAKHQGTAPRLTAEQTKRATELGVRIGKCMQTAMAGPDQASPDQVGPQPQMLPPPVEDR